jgi:hypothetical protein
MAKSTNSCAVCLRYFVIIDSVLFVLIGAGVAAVFIYFQLTQVDFVSTVLGTDIVTAANCLLIAGNCLLLVVAFIGIIGGISRVPSAIAANFLLLILVLLSLLAGIVCALVFKTWLTEEVRYGMRDTLKLKYGVDSKVTESWDKAQSLWKCCAVEDQGWSIYVESEWYNQQPGTPGGGQNAKPYVPRSCCVMDNSGQISDANLRICQTTSEGPPARLQGGQFTGQINPTLHYRGCYQSAQDYFVYENFSWFTIVVGVGTAVACLVLIGICISAAFYVICQRKIRQDKTVMIDDANAHMLNSFK